MSNFKLLSTFEHPQDAHLLIAELESCGIKALLLDENTIQTAPFMSNAIGGVRLMVHESNHQEAMEILTASPLFDTPSAEASSDRPSMTDRIPFLNRIPREYRPFALGAIFVCIVVPLIVLLLLPSA